MDNAASNPVSGLAPDQVLDGKYKVLKELGRGAMGVVYEGVHISLGRHVAIKSLLTELSHDVRLSERFLQEARAASAIGHPHIIDVFDLGRTPEGLLYMVMEKLLGGSLADVITATPRLPVERAVFIILQVLSGLQAAHKNGIVHRDLKPENIFITQSEERPDFVKIVDFGISKVLTSAKGGPHTVRGHAGTMVGTVIGTPLYMAPEQAIGQVEQIDHRTDLYAVGVVLYEILCGRTPFVGETYPDVLSALLDGSYPPPRLLRPDIPPVVEAVIVRALAKDRDKRFPSAQAMRDALKGGEGELTPEPMMLSPGRLPSVASRAGAGKPAVEPTPLSAIFEEDSPIVLMDDAPKGLPRKEAKKAPGLRADPFAPPPEAEFTPRLDGEADHPLAYRSKRATPEPEKGAEKDSPAHGVKVPGTLAPRPAISSRQKALLVKALLLVAVLVLARLTWSYFRPSGTVRTLLAKSQITLQVLPEAASVQVDHIPAKAGPLDLDFSKPHVFNATAAGRITRRFTFDASAGPTLSVRLPHRLSIPSTGDPPPLSTELAVDYPEAPQPFLEIDRAMGKLAVFQTCMDAMVEFEGKPPRVKIRAEEGVRCQVAMAQAATISPPLTDLEEAGQAFLRSLRESGKPSLLARSAQTVRSEIVAGRALWQMEELSREGQEVGKTVGWHTRRVALWAWLWLRAMQASPPEPALVDRRRTQWEAYHRELVAYAEGSREAFDRAVGSGDFLRMAVELGALLNEEKRVNEMKTLDTVRRLVSAFNALILE